MTETRTTSTTTRRGPARQTRPSKSGRAERKVGTRMFHGVSFRLLHNPPLDQISAMFGRLRHDAADWTWGYRNRFLQRYLDIANQVPGTILCLGCELYTVTKELGADFWIGLADWVRGQGFKGPLTYAANWGGWADDAEYKRLKAL